MTLVPFLLPPGPCRAFASKLFIFSFHSSFLLLLQLLLLLDRDAFIAFIVRRTLCYSGSVAFLVVLS